MEKRPIVPQDRAKFLSPGDPQISPDGKTIAFVLQRTDLEKDRFATDIYVVPATGGPPRQLTNTGHDAGPRWSPDAKTLAFVSNRDDKQQLWIIDVHGGEAWCLHTEQAVSGGPAWSPDGKRIAFTSKVFSHGPDWVPYGGAPEGDRNRAETQSAQARDDESGNERRQKGNGQTSDVKVITRIKHRMDGVGYFGDRRSQVFVVDVPCERPRKPVVARQVTTGDHDHDAPSWAPDGKKVAFVATRCEEADWLQKSDIWCADVDTGQMEQLLDAAGMSSAPVWSPDGRTIAYTGHDAKYRGSTSADIRLFCPRIGGPARENDVTSLLEELDRPANAVPSSDVRYALMGLPPVWDRDGSLCMVVGHHGDTFVYRWTRGGPLAKVAGSPDRVISAMTVAGGTIAFQSGSGAEPDEIYCSGPDGVRRLTSFNDHLLTEVAVSVPEKIRYKGADGWDIEGWCMKPNGYEEGKAYPTVLLIHGGPHGVYGPVFQFQAQMLASSGIGVLFTNPRGTQAYGQDFARACVEDWGGKDFQDIMAGVDTVVAAGLADPQRLGVTGWSYGGFMTCWTVTQTQRFKAAITGACISNRHSFYGTSDIGFTFGEHHFGGTPWDDPDKLLERSAIHHIRNVTTPVLILHGEADLRCPVEQAEQFFIALKRQHKHAVLVRYPGEYHGFKKPSHQIDRFARVLAWFEYYLKR